VKRYGLPQRRPFKLRGSCLRRQREPAGLNSKWLRNKNVVELVWETIPHVIGNLVSVAIVETIKRCEKEVWWVCKVAVIAGYHWLSQQLINKFPRGQNYDLSHTPPPLPPPSAHGIQAMLEHIGSLTSLISKRDVRYVGTLTEISIPLWLPFFAPNDLRPCLQWHEQTSKLVYN